MKQLKFILGLALALGVTAPSMAAPTLTVDGDASARFGAMYVRVCSTGQFNDAAMMFMANQRVDTKMMAIYGTFFLASSAKDSLVTLLKPEAQGGMGTAGFLSASADKFTTVAKTIVATSILEMGATSAQKAALDACGTRIGSDRATAEKLIIAGYLASNAVGAGTPDGDSLAKYDALNGTTYLLKFNLMAGGALTDSAATQIARVTGSGLLGYGESPLIATNAQAGTTILGLSSSLVSIQGIWKKYGVTSKDLDKYVRNATNASAGKKNSDRNSLWFGLKNGSDIRTNFNLKDENFSARVVVQYQIATPQSGAATPGVSPTPSVKAKDAWVAYDFGPLKVTYDTVKPQARWNTGILLTSDFGAEGSLDFIIKPEAMKGYGDVFFTFIGAQMNEGAKYEVFKNRQVPITQFGYEFVNDSLSAKVGGVIDYYPGNQAYLPYTTAGTATTAKTGAIKGDYVGWMGFFDVAYTWGKIKELEEGSKMIGFAGLYGQNVDKFAGMDPDNNDAAVNQVVTQTYQHIHVAVDRHGDKRDGQVRGVNLYGAVRLWTGALFYADAQMSQMRYVGESPYDNNVWIDYKWMTSYRVRVALIQFFSKNFNVKLGGGYESYCIAPTGDYGIIPVFAKYPKNGGFGVEGTIETQYLF